MLEFFRRRLRAGAADSGIALIAVVLLVLVTAALGATVTVVGISGLHNATRDRAAAGAEAISNAGVAEALAYIRAHSIGSLGCMESLSGTMSGNCSTPGWTDPTSPEIVSGGQTYVGGACQLGQNCYQVWIGTLSAYVPGAENSSGTGPSPAQPAVLRIHSLGFSGIGPGARSVVVDVTASPANFPIGVFGDTVTEHSAASYVGSESIFTSGSITVKCGLTGWDPEYNIPAAIHSAGTISYQGNCGPGKGDPTTACNVSKSGVPTDPYDQDSNGVSFANTACYNYDLSDPNSSFPPANTRTPYATSSLFTASDLAAYGYQPDGLTPSQYSQLQAQAAAEGTYDNEAHLSTVLANLVAEGVTSPVIYDDNGTAPSLSDFPSQFFRQPVTNGGACPSPNYSLTIIVRNGTIHWSGTLSAPLVASIFVPDPTSGTSYEETGQVSVIGTLFAYSIAFEGNTSPAFQLDSCFVNDPPSGVLDLNVIDYHQVDNGNLQ